MYFIQFYSQTQNDDEVIDITAGLDDPQLENNKGILLNMSNFDLTKLFVCQKDGAYHVFYNTDAGVYIESDTRQGELKIFPNPITQQENSTYTEIACKNFEVIYSLCIGLTTKIREANPFAWPVGLFVRSKILKSITTSCPF